MLIFLLRYGFITFMNSDEYKEMEAYHKKKEEWFFCVSGELELLIKTENKKIVKNISSNIPEIIYVGPGTIHTLVNKTKKRSVVVAYASKELDKKNPDTYQVSEI